MRLPIACLLTPALVAQAPSPAPPDPAQFLPRLRFPLLLVFAPPPEGKDPTQAQLAIEEALEGVYIQASPLAGARPETLDYFKAIRAHLKLGEARWALVLEGRVLAQGIAPITLPALKTLVEGSGFKSPTQQLRAFLKRRPDHLEARLSMLQSLRERAEARTQQALGPAALAKPLPRERSLLTAFDHLPKAEARLKPEDDLRIWGEVYRELDRVLQNGDWLSMDLEPWLARCKPLEAASPLMRGLYQRHRAQILTTLRETPQDRNALGLWAHTSVVLGEPLAPLLESLTPPAPVANRLISRKAWPGESISKLLASEARRNQDGPRLARILGTLWLNGQQERGYNPTGDMTPWRNDWRAYGLPALEAQIQAGIHEAAQPLLESLAEAPNPAALLADAVSLARRLGREDLAQAWQQSLLVPRKPKALRLEEYQLVTTARTAPSLHLPCANTNGTITRNLMTLSLHPEVSPPVDSEACRRFLGWGPQDQRWAVLDQSGRALLDGGEPMDQAQTQKALNNMGLTWTASASPTPPDLWSRTEDLPEQLCQVVLMAKALPPALAQGAGTSQGPDPALVTDFLQRLRAMNEVMKEGLWRRSAMQASWVVGSSYTLNYPETAALARTWTQALEAELVRRPQAWGLWFLWRQWVTLVPDPDFIGLGERLEPDPLKVDQPFFSWPPDTFLSTQTQHHLFYGRWRKLEQLLIPQWDKAKAEAERFKLGQAYQSPWMAIGAPLAQAFWKQDRASDADRLLAESLALGLDRAFLVRTVRSRGFKELADHWDPPKAGRSPLNPTQP